MMNIAVFVLLIILSQTGCGGGGSQRSVTTTTPPGEKTAKNEALVLSKFMMDVWGTEGTFSSDYTDVRDYYDNETREFILRQLDDIYVKTRNLLAEKRQEAPGILIIPPPITLVKYLLYCRLMRNAIGGDPSTVTDATNMFLDPSFPRSIIKETTINTPYAYLPTLDVCESFHTHPDCPSVALRTMMGVLLSLFYGTSHKETLTSTRSLVQEMRMATFEIRHCATEEQRIPYRSFANRIIGVFSDKILKPPPRNMSTKQYVIETVRELKEHGISTENNRNCSRKSPQTHD